MLPVLVHSHAPKLPGLPFAEVTRIGTLEIACNRSEHLVSCCRREFRNASSGRNIVPCSLDPVMIGAASGQGYADTGMPDPVREIAALESMDDIAPSSQKRPRDPDLAPGEEPHSRVSHCPP